MKLEDYTRHLESNDVAEQRYGMFKVFEILLNNYFDEEVDNPIERLRKTEGYLYKLTQDFLSSSGNYEKRQKLEKIAEFVGMNLPEE